ncbi:hypothetical protein [Megamonas sp.]
MQKIYKNPFFLFLVIKIFLIVNIPINDRGYSPHDDYLMVNMAKNLIEGNWLGSFDQYTFIKGITYPVFLAVNYILHIPSDIANTILYFIACLIFIIAIKNIIKKYWYRVFIFFIMFFSPISYAIDTFQRAYRDDIYYSLILMLISAYIGIYLRIKENFEVKRWIIIASVSFTLAWFCREDTVWIIPFMIFFSIVICFRKNITIKNKIICFIMPYIFCIFCGIIIGGINYFVYGIFAINDMQYSSYSQVYSSMTQIKTRCNYNKVTLSRETINKLYEECPSFLELKSYYNGNGDVYEGKGGKMWLSISQKWNEDNIPKNEIGASHSMWAFRAAVSEAGYYETAEKADEFYKRLNNEINKAFKESRLEKKDGVRIPLFTTMNVLEIYELIDNMKMVFNYVVKYYATPDESKIMSPEYYTSIQNAHQELYKLILQEKAMPLFDGHLEGWLVADDNLQLFIENNKNERIKEVIWLKSDDVKKYFEEQNILYKQNNNARFNIYFKIEKKEEPYYLSLYKNGIKIKNIPLTEKEGIDNDLRIRWYFDNVNLVTNKTNIVEYKVIFLQKIASIYATLNNILTYIALLIFIIIGVLIVKNKTADENSINFWMVLFILLIVFLLRVFTIAYNTVTAFNSVFYFYLSPCYPILAAFNGLCLVYGIELLKRLRKEN